MTLRYNMLIIDKTKFENLLLKNWTDFIDHKKLVAIILQNAKDLPVSDSPSKPHLQLKFSMFQPTSDGFLAWAEFSIPYQDTIFVGTSELHISPLGDVTHKQTIGNQKNVT